MRPASISLSIVIVAALSSSARAQERPFTMPDMAGDSRVEVRAAVGTAHRESASDAGEGTEGTTVFSTLAPGGQVAILDWLSARAVLPVALAAGGPEAGPDGAGLGNPTVDVLARRRLEVGGDSFVLGGGGGGSLGLAGSDTASAASAMFYQDLGRFWIHGHTLRLHGDGAWARGPAFAQVQLGIDWHLADGDYDGYRQALARLGVAAGVRPRPDLAILAELTSLSNLIDVKPTDEAEADHFANALELGVRWTRGISAGMSLIIPFDREMSGFYTAAPVGVGVDFAWTPVSATR